MKTKRRRKEPILPPAAFLQCAVPFALPIAGSLILAATIGDAWPRAIAPGSGLKLAGLVITCLTAAGVWRWTTHRLESAPSRKFVALMCAMTGLLGWPAWSAGVLPSINGMSLGPDRV